MREHIVFGFEHYNPLGIVRSLGECGIQPIAIVIKSKDHLLSKSRYLKKVHYVSSIEEGYELLIREYSSNCVSSSNDKKNVIYTSDDQITCFLDNRYTQIKDKFIFNNAGSDGRISFYMDKFNICNLAKECGIDIADTVVAERGEIPSNLSYPIITKAINSTIDNWKADSFICKNENELKAAFEKIRSKRVLIQKYVQKVNELCIDGCSVNKGKNVLFAIASTYDYILPNTYSPLMTVKNFSDTKLAEKLRTMLSKIGFEGIFSIEFLVDKDQNLYFLEINFRNSTWSYASTVAGMNLPKIWFEGMLSSTLPKAIEIATPFK